jgi:two-component system, OmpR family, sensor histidine kinase SenX3
LRIIHRRREWTGYLSHRLWILGVLLIVISALAVLQYHWINQLTDAQRQRTQASLTAALSNVESDFDIEITRAFVAFQLPFADVDCEERYEEWLRHAPYPNLIRGIYTTEAGQNDALPKPVIPGEPPIRSREWFRNLPKLAFPVGGVVTSVGGPIGFHGFSTEVAGGAMVSRNPEITVDGNPAFIFPLMSPVLGVTTRQMTRMPGQEGALQVTRAVRPAGAVRPAQWVILVFDVDYIRSTFLPRLVQLYFGNLSASDYQIFVLDKNGTASSSVVFPPLSPHLPDGFAHPDGKIDLFELRLDCFSPSSSRNNLNVVGTAPEVPLPAIDDLSEILPRKPTACISPARSLESNANGRWELLAKYRAGSLDQAMATFRRRNLFLSGTVLLVLALGFSMLVLLTERARAFAEMQSEFVLGVSHELRTPLTVISVAADNLKKGMVETSDQAHRYGEIIHTQAIELSRMIEETLALARMRSEVIGRRSWVAPERIVKEALADNESALSRTGMEVRLDIASELPPVNVDLHLMKRCVGNLIQNAIKYAAVGQWIAVRARQVMRRNQRMVEISVEDQGPGISADDLPHVFEPFYRGKAADTSPVAGIGLGLTLVRRAVEAHGGMVDVESARVTRFSIFLPADDVPSNGHKAG